MSFLRSLITAGPVRPSVLTDIISYQSLFLFFCYCLLTSERSECDTYNFELVRYMCVHMYIYM